MQTLYGKDAAQRASTKRHFYQFYKGREDLFRVVIPFLCLGLENREACLWVVSHSIGILSAVTAFQREINLLRFVENGQLLIVPAERWYLNRGRFSERKILERFEKFIQDQRRSKFSVFRVVGDLGWLEDRDWDRFQSYESKIRNRGPDLKFTAICAYPIERCTLPKTKDVLDHHEGVFLNKL